MIKLTNLLEDTLQESVYDKGVFKAAFLGGLPGAGKSYTIAKVTDGSIQPQIINFDKYAEFLGQQMGIKDVGGAVEKLFIDKTKQMTITQLSLYINSMLPLFVDSTSNKINRTIYRDGLLKSMGYDTAMVWVETSLETAIKRAQQRQRTVPVAFIKAVHKNLAENKDYYKNHFSLFVEINNNDGELTNKTIVEAYRKISGFFKTEIVNPLGRRNKTIAEKSGGYLTPGVYIDINKIKSKLINWY